MGKSMETGVFITLEGGEGAGKSTQMQAIENWLTDQGHDVLCTRQPGGTVLSEKIRALLLDARNTGMSATSELLLLFADRAEFLDSVVRPALAAGKTVLCDRFTDSTYAYQGGGRGVPIEDIGALEQLVQQGLQPDLTVLIDLDPVIGAQRAAQRGEADRFEREEPAFFQRVRAAYLDRAGEQPARYAVVDGDASPEAVSGQILAVLAERLAS